MTPKDWITIIVSIASAAVVGGYMRGQLDSISKDVTEIKGILLPVKTQSDQQTVTNENVKECVEILTDRVDMHAQAIKNLEIAQARQKGIN